MKKIVIALLVGTLLFSGCRSGDQAPCSTPVITTKAPDEEVAALKTFITTNKIPATADSRGFYYIITSAGSGAKPTACANVTVNYKGMLTNKTSFDSGNGVSFGLNQLIVGWQEGIPLIAPGGRITLYLPPSLAYGSQDQAGIPANSILVFDIDLIKVE